MAYAYRNVEITSGDDDDDDDDNGCDVTGLSLYGNNPLTCNGDGTYNVRLKVDGINFPANLEDPGYYQTYVKVIVKPSKI